MIHCSNIAVPEESFFPRNDVNVLTTQDDYGQRRTTIEGVGISFLIMSCAVNHVFLWYAMLIR